MQEELFYGGPILTMDRQQKAEALLMRGNRIAAVGCMAEVESAAAPDARRTNLHGSALLPAFIDPHSHLMGVASSLLRASLTEADSYDAIARALRTYMEESKLPAGAWLNGAGYDTSRLAEKRTPDRHFLDTITPDRPAVIQHVSGHMGVFNTLALQQLGVTRDTPDPEGGRIGRDENGEPTGYMEENAFLNYLRKLPFGTQDELDTAIRRAQEIYASHGIATCQEGMLILELAQLYQSWAQRGLLFLDVVGYASYVQRDEIRRILGGYVGGYKGNFRLGGDKMFLDGSPQSRTAWLRKPYLGEPAEQGYPTMTDEQVFDAICTDAADGTQLLAHCNGDAAAEQFLTQIANARDAGARPWRPVMIHAQLLAPDQLPQVRRLGVIPSFFAAHVFHWGDLHLQNLGPERVEHISAAGSALREGIPFTFHQDSPVLPPDMLETLWVATQRLTSSGRLLGEDERIPMEEALRAVTLNAAYQYCEEGEKGSLRPGKRADLVLLSGDPLASPDPRELQVLRTIKAGDTIYEA